MADTLRCPNDGGTADSRTTPAAVPRVRSAAAALRRVLTAHAAERLGVQPEQIAFRDGVFRTADRQLTLAEIAQDERLAEQLGKLPVPEVAVVEVLRKELTRRSVPEEKIATLRCPIGLPLGNNTPPEIAISIAAQLIQVRDEIAGTQSAGHRPLAQPNT